MEEPRLLELSGSESTDHLDATVYVKGFLGRGEEADHFDAWLRSHRSLVRDRGWGERAYGYSWPSGRISGIPLPLLGGAKTAYDVYRGLRGVGRGHWISSLGLIAGEQVVRMSARFLVQYTEAARNAREHAEALAIRLAELRLRHSRLRVVAHSLGCLQVIEAVSSLSSQERPDEVHLCAPACRESDVGEKLPNLAARETYLYFTGSDLVLETAFRAVSLGRALGAAGPTVPYAGLQSFDVGSHFGFWVHADYKTRFPEFAGGETAARLGEPDASRDSLPESPEGPGRPAGPKGNSEGT